MSEPSEFKKLPHVPNACLATTRLCEALATGRPGDTLTDVQLRAICGRDTAPGGDGYSNLQSAIRWAVRQKGVVWDRVRADGLIKCLADPEKGSLADSKIVQAGRRSRRALRILDAVQVGGLSEAERSQHQANVFRALVMERMARKKALDLLTAAKVSKALPTEAMVKALLDQAERRSEKGNGDGK